MQDRGCDMRQPLVMSFLGLNPKFEHDIHNEVFRSYRWQPAKEFSFLIFLWVTLFHFSLRYKSKQNMLVTAGDGLIITKGITLIWQFRKMIPLRLIFLFLTLSLSSLSAHTIHSCSPFTCLFLFQLFMIAITDLIAF